MENQYTQVLERDALTVNIQDVIGGTEIDITARDVWFRSKLQKTGIQASNGCGSARKVSGGVGDFLEPLDDLSPLHDFRSSEFHGLSSKLLRFHAILANGSSHIADPDGLLETSSAIDVN